MIGYACINTHLREQNIYTNRKMIKRTFNQKGIEGAFSLSHQNLIDLFEILKWNEANEIKFFRMSSDIFPWMSEWDLQDLPQQQKDLLKIIGNFARDKGHRLTFHPGPYNVLASPKEDVVLKTIKELNQHGRIMDMMELDQTPHNKINIHIGGVYGNKLEAMNRFIINYDRLEDSAKKRLTIENDDNPNGYTIVDLGYVHDRLGIPLVFDVLHHKCNSGGIEAKMGLNGALKTWGKIKPVIHYSESGCTKNLRKHSDFIKKIEYSDCYDTMIEAKMKEKCIFRLKNQFNFI